MPRTRPGLYQRKGTAFWWACWITPDGHVVNRSTDCRDRGAAALFLAGKERQAQSAALGLPVAKQAGLAVALAEYLVERDLAPKWAATVEGFFRLEVIPYFGAGTVVSSITEPQVLRFRNEQKRRPDRRFKPREGVEPKLISSATVNRLFWVLQAFGTWAVRRSYSFENPWASVDTLPEDEVAIPEIDAATWAKFLLAFPLPPAGKEPPYRFREVLELARELGMRKGELARLGWADFDLVERVGFIVSSHQRGRTKTRKGRPFAISLRAAEVLKGIEKRGRRLDGLVFGKIGDHRHSLATAAKTAGLPRAWIHLMRHLGASAFARGGATNNELQAFGGWSSLKMAERYTKIQARRLREALDRGSAGSSRETVAAEKEKGGSP